MGMKRGIDVSAYQGVIDWKAVRASGVDFCMVKAMQGTREAEGLERNLTGAYAAGLTCGVYHYLTAVDIAMADEQMDALLALLARYRPLIRLYVALDVESGSLPRDRAALTEIVRRCYGRIEDAGYKAIVYTNPDWLRNRLGGVADLRLWLAAWRDKARLPSLADYPMLRLWQWGKDYVDGIFHEDNGKRVMADENLMLVEEEAVPAPASPPPAFSDIAGHRAEADIAQCKAAGLLNGYPDGTFQPDEPPTRAEMATVFARLLNKIAEGDDRK